jgi:uncharacterized protein (TIGR02147 family)
VYEFFDYRELLKDLYKRKKSRSPRFSYRVMAKKVGYPSPALFTRVTNGEINLQQRLVPGFSKVFGLRKPEVRYLQTLLSFDLAKTHEQKDFYFTELLRQRRGRVEVLTEDKYELFSNWYFVAVRELIEAKKFSGNYKELADSLMPRISPAQARKAVEKLERLGLIKKNARGYYQKTNATLTTGEVWSSLAIEHFQREAAELALEAMDRLPRGLRDMSTLTLSISGETYEKLLEKVKDCRRELLEIANEDKKADRVYQVNFQVFPLSRVKGDSQE